MICFPNCKVNLGLRIVRKRSDGYHDLETIFYPVHGLHDCLEITENKSFEFHSHGLQVSGATEDNLVVKAFKLMQEKFDIPNVKVHLIKNIPMGAGLGGGSSDAAFMLSALDKLFKLNCTAQQLKDFALQLGSDCPFFIDNEVCKASGRGEVFTAIDLSLTGCYIYLIKPPIHISTAQAFSSIVPNATRTEALEDAAKVPIEQWQRLLVNDFEESIFPLQPILATIKEQLLNHGALYASLSGTGSTVFGIFKQKPSMLEYPSDYFTGVYALK